MVIVGRIAVENAAGLGGCRSRGVGAHFFGISKDWCDPLRDLEVWVESCIPGMVLCICVRVCVVFLYDRKSTFFFLSEAWEGNEKGRGKRRRP
ncbi:MAG: hypothetical protein CL912_12140 [Deltaproteobacteria bacterium]|nr:hypothetical protein [Deltaproteobacteria bacterium]